jgi:putative ABC transport system permease protein
VRQTLVETGLLGLLGIVLAIPVTYLVLALSVRIAPADIPRLDTAGMDWHVLGFLVAGAVLWVLALGSLPVAAPERRLMSPSRASSRDVVQVRALGGFAVAQIAIAVIVAVGAALLVRSFGNLQRIDRGFRASDVTLVRLLLPEARYPTPRHRRDFFHALLSRVQAVPGVNAASTIHMAPGTASVGLSARMLFEGQTARAAASNPLATWEPVLGPHFETLGIPLVRGRLFSDADTRTAMPVAIVTDAVARRYWPGEDPLGKRLKLADEAAFGWTTVVGVVGDTRYRELTRPWMTVYFPADQFFFFQPELVVRTSPEAAVVMAHVRGAIQSLEPDAAIERMEPMTVLLDREVSRPRAALAVSTLLAIVAALLSVAGVYGVLSYEVRSRRVELALRSALGSSPGRLAGLVLGRGVRVGGMGAVLGLIGAALATPLVGSVLFEVSPLDGRAFATGVGILVAIVVAISCVPARRAANVDALSALRHD